MPLSTISPVAVGQVANLADHLLGGRAAARPAHERNDAERAAVVAAILDFQVGASAVAGGVLHGRGEEVALGENVAHIDVAMVGGRSGRIDDVRDLRLVRIANHPFHAR